LQFVDYVYEPLLQTLADGHAVNTSAVNALTLADSTVAADIVINNLDVDNDHPYHLHGYDFFIVARGQGKLDESAASSIRYNTHNPLRRDTLVVPRSSWAVLRITNANPGVWPLHCHIAWHLSLGFLGVVVSKPEEIKAIGVPPQVRALCPSPDSVSEPLDTAQPGRKRSLYRRRRSSYGSFFDALHIVDGSL
jgi:Multicopper oxidase